MPSVLMSPADRALQAKQLEESRLAREAQARLADEQKAMIERQNKLLDRYLADLNTSRAEVDKANELAEEQKRARIALATQQNPGDSIRRGGTVGVRSLFSNSFGGFLRAGALTPT